MGAVIKLGGNCCGWRRKRTFPDHRNRKFHYCCTQRKGQHPLNYSSNLINFSSSLNWYYTHVSACFTLVHKITSKKCNWFYNVIISSHIVLPSVKMKIWLRYVWQHLYKYFTVHYNITMYVDFFIYCKFLPIIFYDLLLNILYSCI